MNIKALVFDIELAPLLSYTWGLFDQNIGLNQIKSDWHLLSFAAKWLGKKDIFYMDQRDAKNIEDDRKLLEKLWCLLDEADVVITQNGKSFDCKKVNARFVIHGMKPPSPYKHIDTLQLARRNFSFASNKLEYLSNKLCVNSKKLKSHVYVGFDLWKACLANENAAWRELRRYNIGDVLATEELYTKLAPWGSGVDFNILRDEDDFLCNCGSSSFIRRGFNRTIAGKFQRWQCKDCGAFTSSKGAANNLMDGEKKKSLQGPK